MAGDCGSTCPVSGGFYSYAPYISGNATFIAIYGLLFLATLFLGRRNGTLWHTSLLSASHLLQSLAFVGRVLLHRARDSQPYFLIFLLGTLLAPLFAASTIISALPSTTPVEKRHKALCGLSRLLFGIQGLIVLVVGLEVAGAVLVCYGQPVLPKTKSTIIVITGLGVQTFSLVLISSMCAVALYRGSTRARGNSTSTRDDSLLGNTRRGLEAASVAILLHSVYRIVEMALGISGALFQSETAFMVANGALPLVYCMLLTIFSPRQAAQPLSILTSPTAEKRKGRPPGLTQGDGCSAQYGNSPHAELPISPASQNSHASNAAEVPSKSSGLPANPRPTPAQNWSLSPMATKVHNSRPTLTQNSASHNRPGKRGRVVQGMVETDDLW